MCRGDWNARPRRQRLEEDAEVPAQRLRRLGVEAELVGRDTLLRARGAAELAREVVEAGEREHDAVLEGGEEAAHPVGIVVERAVLRLVVNLEVELDAEVARVARRLDELARPAPDEGAAAAEALPVAV